jgi:hypothetical protein
MIPMRVSDLMLKFDGVEFNAKRTGGRDARTYRGHRRLTAKKLYRERGRAQPGKAAA